MGGGTPLTPIQQLKLVDGLANHPSSFVLFIFSDEQIVGLATCFINFSTFSVQSVINIHDLIIDLHHRGKGLGRDLIQAIEVIAKEHKCGKITLEVRADNYTPQKLYYNQGFTEGKSKMYFWTKELSWQVKAIQL